MFLQKITSEPYTLSNNCTTSFIEDEILVGKALYRLEVNLITYRLAREVKPINFIKTELNKQKGRRERLVFEVII